MSINIRSSGRELSFLLLPLGFFAQSQSAASVGSSAVVPVSGSPAGRNLSRALGPQLVPKCRHKARVERNTQVKKRNMNLLNQISNEEDFAL